MKKEIENLSLQLSALEKESDQKVKVKPARRSLPNHYNLGTDFDLAAMEDDAREEEGGGGGGSGYVDLSSSSTTPRMSLRRRSSPFRSSARKGRVGLDEIDPNQRNKFFQKTNNNSTTHGNANANANTYTFTDSFRSPESLIKGLDSTDDYVKRQFPPVPKTPGTMFATEFVEVMGLDVGDHAYLAEVMDRQWRTTTDYRP